MHRMEVSFLNPQTTKTSGEETTCAQDHRFLQDHTTLEYPMGLYLKNLKMDGSIFLIRCKRFYLHYYLFIALAY